MALDQNFYTKLNRISSEVGMNPRDLLLVMYSESGLKANNPNADGGANGLIQFMPDTLRGLGVPKDQIKDFGKKTEADQLDYVKKYIQGQMSFTGRPFHSASEYYHANFFPKTLKRWRGSDPIQNADVVICAKDAQDPQERIAYKHNLSLDTDKDGKITVGDMTRVLQGRAASGPFRQFLANFNSVSGEGAVTEAKISPDFMKPGKAMVAKMPTDSSNPRVEGFLQQIVDWVGRLFPTATAAREQSPFVIKVLGSDFGAKVEYLRILQSVLDEEISASSTIHTAGTSAEMTVSMPFSSQSDNKKSLKEISSAVSMAFMHATKQIGGCEVIPMVSVGKASELEPLPVKIAEIQRRKFQLRFAKDRQ